MASIVTWPNNGFESYFEYVSSFVHLNINLGSPEACKRYHDSWLPRYRHLLEGASALEVAIWCVRCRQALKLSFSATYFALSANDARDIKCSASAYYLDYYAMLHAMWAVLFLHPNESLEALTDITHSKIANVFDSCFCKGAEPVLRYDAITLAEDMRFLREYYSYRMRWLRLSEQLRTKDKWIPAGFGWCDALLGCDAGRA